MGSSIVTFPASNNVLLIVGSRAKVTDFGMSKFTDINITGRLATMTTCPGTPAFMSPEALNKPPVYTDKLDNFSFGVLIVQITTRQFPKPTDRFVNVQIPDPRSPHSWSEVADSRTAQTTSPHQPDWAHQPSTADCASLPQRQRCWTTIFPTALPNTECSQTDRQVPGKLMSNLQLKMNKYEQIKIL